MVLVSHSKRQKLLEIRCSNSLVCANWESVCYSSLASTVTTVLHIRPLCSQGPLLPGMCIIPRAGPMGNVSPQVVVPPTWHALSALNVSTKGRHLVQRPGNFIKKSRKTIKETLSCLFKIQKSILVRNTMVIIGYIFVYRVYSLFLTSFIVLMVFWKEDDSFWKNVAVVLSILLFLHAYMLKCDWKLVIFNF